MSTPASRSLPAATPTFPPKPILRLAQAEMRARREHGLCFNCDEQYWPGHRCRQSHILMLLADEDFSDFQSEPKTSNPSDPSIGDQPAPPIALNAISATKRSRGRAMHLEGVLHHTRIQVFIDSGADQSFLNPQVAARLGLPIDSTSNEAVMVATGRYFRTKGMARNVSVHLRGYDFRADFHLLAVVGCDMVLGVDWLETLGLIGWNFLLKVIEFTVQGTNYHLVGSSAHSAGAIPPLSSLDPSLRNPLHIMAQISNLPTGLYHPTPLPDILQALLLQYSDIF
ncbi:hypothetical protein COP2_015652 [Malus domestica]